MLWILPIPGIVCSVLSIEIGFKALLLHAGQIVKREHNLTKLFQKLGPWQQNELILAAGLDREQFQTELHKISDAFVEWRYDYEYPELQINLGFLDRLAAGTQAVMSNALGA